MIRLLILLALITGLKECIAVKNVIVEYIPEKVVEGNDVELTCQYDLEGDILFAIKWYRGQSEFFRYTKHEQPQIKTFPLKNINVDISASSVDKVKLVNVTTGTKGKYKCVVLPDGPAYNRNGVGKKKLVVSAAQHKTLIHSDINTTIPALVKVSDTANISCSYSPTKNSATLKSVAWKKNGKLFYKYEPETEFNIALQLHKLSGINFSVIQTSNLTEISIHKATADTEGEYTCQVDYGSVTLISSRILLVKEQTSKPVIVTVPALVNKGENVLLKCRYKLRGSEIGSVKWFKGNREFFSYTVDEEPTITPIDGVDVQDLITDDEYRSFVSTILLKQVNFDTAGKYRCTVTPDGGHLQFSDSGILSVLRLPHGEPTIFVENDYLRYGDQVHAECASPPSYPYANVTWFLNENEILGKDIKDLNDHVTIGFPYPTTSKLSHRVDFQYENTVNLTCVVTISDVYRSEKTVKIERDNSVPNRFNDYSSMAMSSGYKFLIMPTYIISIVSSLVLVNW
ncbi:unnamed protein product [Psylliodes chrysocephalus]|uniref:Ig-like domain-containing protein n=1 Tax=Psylliodes chrysocephalus TaxID=3402493 RepID=A0A9P0CGF5_9CUCU|nr:unnamed protein product [Psylliodes chrysocephala]